MEYRMEYKCLFEYWRQYPFMLVEQVFGIKLKWYQKIYLMCAYRNTIVAKMVWYDKNFYMTIREMRIKNKMRRTRRQKNVN